MLFNVFPKTCRLKDNCVMGISREATASPDEPVTRVDHSHQHDGVEVFKIMILLAGFSSTGWTLDWNVASIYCSPQKGNCHLLFISSIFLKKSSSLSGMFFVMHSCQRFSIIDAHTWVTIAWTVDTPNPAISAIV